MMLLSVVSIPFLIQTLRVKSKGALEIPPWATPESGLPADVMMTFFTNVSLVVVPEMERPQEAFRSRIFCARLLPDDDQPAPAPKRPMPPPEFPAAMFDVRILFEDASRKTPEFEFPETEFNVSVLPFAEAR
jgi:hypothetical protein